MCENVQQAYVLACAPLRSVRTSVSVCVCVLGVRQINTVCVWSHSKQHGRPLSEQPAVRVDKIKLSHRECATYGNRGIRNRHTVFVVARAAC